MSSKRRIEQISTAIPSENPYLSSPTHSSVAEEPSVTQLIVVGSDRESDYEFLDPEDRNPPPPRPSFFVWKEYNKALYWNYQFLKECETAKELTCGHLPHLQVEWPEFVRVILSTAHFIALASSNYLKEPFNNCTKRRRPPYFAGQRRVLFGELIAAFCPEYIEREEFCALRTGLKFAPNLQVYTVSTHTKLRVTRTLLRTTYRILLEALVFLVSIGFVEVSFANITTKDKQELPTLEVQDYVYSEVAYRLFLHRDCESVPGFTEPVFCFRVHTEDCPRQDFAWHQLRIFLFTSLNQFDRYHILVDPEFFEYTPKYHQSKPYWCPYLNYPRPGRPFSSSSTTESTSIVALPSPIQIADI